MAKVALGLITASWSEVIRKADVTGNKIADLEIRICGTWRAAEVDLAACSQALEAGKCTVFPSIKALSNARTFLMRGTAPPPSRILCGNCPISQVFALREAGPRSVSGRQPGQSRQDKSMFPFMKLSRALNRLRPLASSSLKLPRITAPQADGSERISKPTEGGTGLKLDERAIDRLLLRAEVELCEPDAIQRREAIARLKLAAANSRG